eukprot:4034086-Amphidinium_carterae.1
MGIKRIGCNGGFLICSLSRRPRSASESPTTTFISRSSHRRRILVVGKSTLWFKIRTKSMDVLSERTT